MKVREFLDTKSGKRVVIACSLACVVIAIYSARSLFRGDTPDEAFYSTYVCSETGKAFKHKNVLGESFPIRSPYSGKETGYPAESCFWNVDGTTKTEPTWVLLNQAIGKPGRTFCPDCGRLVVGHNPRPGTNSNPPPTEAEYAARHSGDAVDATDQR